MTARRRKLYWIKAPKDQGGDDLLVLDPGYEGGQVHIYTKKESIDAKTIIEELERAQQGKPLHEGQERNAVSSWAQRKGSLAGEWSLH